MISRGWSELHLMKLAPCNNHNLRGQMTEAEYTVIFEAARELANCGDGEGAQFCGHLAALLGQVLNHPEPPPRLVAAALAVAVDWDAIVRKD